jgi:hypothetical protein
VLTSTRSTHQDKTMNSSWGPQRLVDVRGLAGIAIRVGVVLLAILGTESLFAMTRIVSTPTGYGRSGDRMGQAVAVKDDTALVAAPNAQPAPMLNSGVVEVFRQDVAGWHFEAVLLPDDVAAGMQFGAGPALGQDIAVVIGHAGTAYTFVRDGSQWTQTDKLTFGAEPSLSDQTLVLNDGNIARVYVRVGNAWVQQADLQGDLSPAQGEYVTTAVVDGDIAAISTLMVKGSFSYAVAHYFFARTNDTWVREAKIDVGTWGGFPPPPAVIALDGQTAIIAMDGVRAYVRDSGVWTSQGMLDPLVPWDWEIPPSLTLQGDIAIVGVPSDDVLGSLDVGSAYVFSRTGSSWSRTDHVYDPAGTYGSQFGASMGLSGDALLSGSPGALTDAGAAGKATVFAFDVGAWNVTDYFDGGNAHAGEGFGSSVAMSGSTMAVGAPTAPSAVPFSTGVAYVFEIAGDGWVQQARLGSSSVNYAGFGLAVALDADTLAVGSQGDYVSGDEYQGVYIYTRSGSSWDVQTRLGSGVSYGTFGAALALQGDLLAVGDAGWPGQVPEGRVRLYERSGTIWTEQPMVQAVEITAYDRFGAAVALSGDTLVVGAPGTNVEIEQAAGAAYVFQRVGSDWQEQGQLLAPEPLEGAAFGMSVAVAGDTAVVGAGGRYGADDVGGAAYVFTRTAGTWSLTKTLAPAGVAPVPGSFGYSISLSGDENIALVGMPSGLNAANAAGVVYAFARNGSDWTPRATLYGSQYPQPDSFGLSLAFSGSEAVIGSPAEFLGGAAYATSFGDEVFSDGFEQTP